MGEQRPDAYDLPLQIGNHLGALAQWQKLVKEAAQQPEDKRDALFFSVVGMHALTVPQVRLSSSGQDGSRPDKPRN